MEIKPTELPFLSNIGLMLTYRCTIACPHCIVEAGPHRKEEMRLEDSLAWIEQASTYRDGHIKGLALTGGEPFYNLDDLAQISAHGQALGFIVSVVTNAFWASTKDVALEVLTSLPAIQMISISTDVYHQKSIPFDHIHNAVWAARQLGRLYNIAVCTDNEEDQQHQKIMHDLKAIGEADRIRVSITYPVGRAQSKARHFSYRTACEPTVSACTMASSPVVFPEGKVSACIGPVLTLPPMHPMFLGNLQQETLSEILDRSELNPVLHTIRAWGPHKLVSFLRQHELEALLPKEYICNCLCDVCYKLMSDERIVAALESILQDEQIRQTIAYARLYYLNETTMAELYHLHATDFPDRRKLNSDPGAASTAPASAGT
jgi:MoaA/NifB/PqqE/SkfB family radical SAM enzyme